MRNHVTLQDFLNRLESAEEMPVVSKKRSTRNKLGLDAEWHGGSRTQAWDLLWQRILAEIKRNADK